MQINRFTIRVYGILEHEGKILLAHEKIGAFHFTKFPGGGLEPGEGTVSCLIREFKEEADLDISVIGHLYTTDFFQQSAFRETDQIVAIYYLVKSLNDPLGIRLDEFEIMNNDRMEQMRFFWVDKTDLTEEQVTFPIDKVVCRLINPKRGS